MVSLNLRIDKSNFKCKTNSMQTEFRINFSWKRGLSMLLLTLFSFSVAVAQVLVRGTVVDQTGCRSLVRVSRLREVLKARLLTLMASSH